MARILLQPLAIFHRLFRFVIDFLAARGLKPVILGSPTDHGVANPPVAATPSPPDGVVDSTGGNTVGTATPEKDENKAENNQTHEPENSVAAPTEASGSLEKGNPALAAQAESSLQPAAIPWEDKEEAAQVMGAEKVVGSSSSSSEQSHQDKGQEESVLPAPSTVPPQARSLKKTVTIKDATEELGPPKEDEKKTHKEKLKQEKDKGTKVQPQRPPRSILKVPSNINEKSEEFIQRRRETLRTSSGPSRTQTQSRT
uniref:Uncharacterized protein n=1 Tax=Nelumbo nucifera TaxID=4432 RepID=A0A822YM10_NELNU|nr:TPA_asm: hypothetical protein HUJ06_012378 [Nelumbo nucifera]